MEYFDILDENGNLTGKQKPRNLVHQDGDLHKSVHVWIVNSNNQVLMQKRSPNKESHPNMWDISFAGHISSGDTSIETVIKEGGEELGIDVAKSEIQFLFTYKKQLVLNNGTFINNEFNDVYLIKKDLDISTIKLQKEEVSEVKWFSISEMKDILNEKRKGYLIHEKEYEALINLIK
jgi:isopentenyl-diphosphate delta-isomerase type 1